jgi:hypothetical protein
VLGRRIATVEPPRFASAPSEPAKLQLLSP